MKQSRERYFFVKVCAGLLRLPLFLVQSTTTQRVKHADEGLSSAFLLFSPFSGAPLVRLAGCANEPIERSTDPKSEGRRGRRECRATGRGGRERENDASVPFDSGKAIRVS